MATFFFSFGSFLAGLAVAAGAYSAHGGPTLDPDHARWIAKAARYQMYHGLALICVSFAITLWPFRAAFYKLAGWFFLLGIALFSGSLYLMAFVGIDLGYVTPAGGISFLVAWSLMAVAGLFSKVDSDSSK